MNLREIVLKPIQTSEEALLKIGRTLRYVATWRGEWLALLSFSAPALKCAARDRGRLAGIFAISTTACTWSPTTAAF